MDRLQIRSQTSIRTTFPLAGSAARLVNPEDHTNHPDSLQHWASRPWSRPGAGMVACVSSTAGGSRPIFAQSPPLALSPRRLAGSLSAASQVSASIVVRASSRLDQKH